MAPSNKNEHFNVAELWLVSLFLEFNSVCFLFRTFANPCEKWMFINHLCTTSH